MLLTWKINAKVVTRKLQKASRDARRMTDAWRKVADIVLDSIQMNFDRGGRPRWRHRKKRYQWRILRKTMALRDSITARHGARGITVFSSLPYAATHQYGRGPIPARPFMLLQDKDQKAIRKAVLNHLTRAFG